MARISGYVYLVLAGLGLTTACARTVQSTSNGALATAGATVQVQNQNFSDVDVYVVSEGVATRLGTVTGNSTSTFSLDPSFFPASEFRIVATPIGGNGRASSGQLIVSPGQTIVFTIRRPLRASSAAVQ